MGWMEDASTVPELKDAGLKEKGQLSGVIKSSVGFLVARLDDVQPAQVKPLADVRNDIAAKVKQEKSVGCLLRAAAEGERCGQQR